MRVVDGLAFCGGKRDLIGDVQGNSRGRTGALQQQHPGGESVSLYKATMRPEASGSTTTALCHPRTTWLIRFHRNPYESHEHHDVYHTPPALRVRVHSPWVIQAERGWSGIWGITLQPHEVYMCCRMRVYTE